MSENANSEQQEAWREVVGQRRLLSYELRVDTLASWSLGSACPTAKVGARGQNEPMQRAPEELWAG